MSCNGPTDQEFPARNRRPRLPVSEGGGARRVLGEHQGQGGRQRPAMTYARRGGFLDPYPFPPGAFGIAPNDLEATDTSQLLALVVAQKALEDAGLSADRAG